MSNEPQDDGGDGWKVFLSLGITAMVVLLLYRGGSALVDFFWPAPQQTIAIAAFFNGTPPRLQVTGRLLVNGVLVDAATAKVTVEAVNTPFRQSVLTDVVKGKLEVSDVPEFRSVTPDMSLRITVQTNVKDAEISDEVYIVGAGGTRSGSGFSLIRRARANIEVLGLLAFVSGTVFFWAFTGGPSRVKNHAAVILSYCVILLALALPLLTPVMLPALFPEMEAVMRHAAVGVLVAQARDDDKNIKGRQWALNIGGYVVDAEPEVPAAPPAPAIGNAAEVTPAAPDEAGRPEGAQTQPIPPAIVTTGPPQGDADGGQGDPPAVERTSATSDESWKAVKVEGGLVIPLYVILLSVIGGAINMTRQVPNFQEQSDVQVFNGFTIHHVAKLLPFGGGAKAEAIIKVEPNVAPAPARPLQEGTPHESGVLGVGGAVVAAAAEASQTEGEAAATAAVVVPADSATPAPPAAPTQPSNEKTWSWAAKWRSGLLSLYMYLLSAPFLAIAMYYLLQGLDLTKVPVLVLVSFSIGLMSEAIIETILSAARRFLDTK